MTEKLKPCPFCQGKARIHEDVPDCSHYPTTYEVVCDERDCGISGPMKDTEAEAISAWNARPAEGALVHILDRLINELPTKRDWFDPDLEAQARAALKAAKGE